MRYLAYVAILWLAWTVGLVWAQTASEAPAKPRVTAVTSIGLTVRDVDRSADFFSRVLSFEKTADVEVAGEPYERLFGVFGARMRIVTMRLGDECLELMEFLTPRGRPMPSDSHANDQWFQHVAIIVSDMDAAYQRLRQHKVEHASTGPQTLPDWNKNAAGIKAFYFRDPDGHFLEMLQFPAEKGASKWRKKDRLFLGIDHTAIVVRDTEESLRFYRDGLGLKVVGESENHGTEQEHLNNVFSARLRITTLRAEQGPAVELLEYLSPRDSRSTPVDSRANDLWHWHVKIQKNEVDLLNKRFLKQSTGITLPDANLDVRDASLIADPDGHHVLLSAQ